MSRKQALLDSGLAADPEPMARQARANIADRHVGARVRERRLLAGLSQQQLAQMIGVAYQQAHKYERGLNRISAGRLFQIATVLQAPISWFFEGLDPQSAAAKLLPLHDPAWTAESLK